MSGMSDETPRQYLLRRLPEAEADLFEARILADDECAERLREAEDDLLDDYAAGQLPADERDAVERYLLHTRDAEQRLRFARALADARQQGEGLRSAAAHSSAGRPPELSRTRRWFVPLGLLVAASVGFILVALQLSQAPTPRGVPPDAGTPVLPPPVETTATAKESEQATPHAVLLLAEVRRGSEGMQRVSIPPRVEQIRLQLEVSSSTRADDAAAYQMVVRAADGQQLYVATSLASRLVGAFRIVESVVPARVLGTGVRRVALRRAAGDDLLPVFDWEIDVRAGDGSPEP